MAELNSTPQKNSPRAHAKKPALRVDLTAMVDLAFLLITFFILTTTLSKPKSMEVTMPVGNEPGGVSDLRTMTICLGKDNRVLYYLGAVAKPIVPATLTGYGRHGIRTAIVNMRNNVLHSTGKSMIVLIKPAKTSVYENLVNTLDEMKITNIQQYAISDIARADINLLKEKKAY